MFARKPSTEFQGRQSIVCVGITFWLCAQAGFVVEFREDVQIIIPTISEYLKHSDLHVSGVAIKIFSRLAVHGMR
jgi:hypothetical protein